MKLEIVLASLFLLITTRQNTPPHCLEGNGFVQGPYGIWGTLFCVTVCSVPAAVCALIPLKTVSSYVVCTRTYVYKVISVNKRLRQFFLRHRHRERLTRDSWLPRAWDDNSVRPLVLGARPPCSALSTNSGYKIGPEPSLIATVRDVAQLLEGAGWLLAALRS